MHVAVNNTCTKVRSLSGIFFNHGQLIRLIITFFWQLPVQPGCGSLLWGSFTETLWCPVCGNKQGVLGYPLCVNLQILRTLELPVCLFVPRLIDQFTKIYDPRVGSIYRELWWNICHNLQGFFNPRVVNFANKRFTTRMYKHSKQILLKSKSRYVFAFLYCCSGGSRGGARRARPPPLIFRPNWGKLRKKNLEITPPLISGSGWLGTPPPPLI